MCYKREKPLSEISRCLGMSKRMVQQLCSDGIIPKPEIGGRYDVQGSIAAYVQHLRRKVRSLEASKPRKKRADFWKQPVKKLSPEQEKVVWDFSVINRTISDLVSRVNQVRSASR